MFFGQQVLAMHKHRLIGVHRLITLGKILILHFLDASSFSPFRIHCSTCQVKNSRPLFLAPTLGHLSTVYPQCLLSRMVVTVHPNYAFVQKCFSYPIQYPHQRFASGLVPRTTKAQISPCTYARGSSPNCTSAVAVPYRHYINA